MQPPNPTPLRPAYTRAWSSDRSELPYLQPEPEPNGLPLPYDLPHRATRPGGGWVMYPHRSNDYFDRPVPSRRVTHQVIPELHLNDGLMPQRRESQPIEALEVEEPLPADPLPPLALRICVVLIMAAIAAIPGALVYVAYRLVKKDGL